MSGDVLVSSMWWYASVGQWCNQQAGRLRIPRGIGDPSGQVD